MTHKQASVPESSLLAPKRDTSSTTGGGAVATHCPTPYLRRFHEAVANVLALATTGLLSWFAMFLVGARVTAERSRSTGLAGVFVWSQLSSVAEAELKSVGETTTWRPKDIHPRTRLRGC